MSKYRHNHYVPEWYQRRFMLPSQHRYYRLDLRPDVVVRDGHKYTRKDVHHWSPEQVFAEEDLYTTRWGDIRNTEIEQFFFGKFDQEAPKAIEFWASFDHTNIDHDAFNTLMSYMSVQKLRTPKGLAYFELLSRSLNRNNTLILLQQMQNMFCAVWTESIWQLADATQSPTKLIISDHPVTVYNRACPPLSKWCQGCLDPDVRLSATHTYFPLSLNRVLIFTNLSWVRDPYQNELRPRPNEGLFRNTIFNFLSIQVGRQLSEEEVLQINLITKKRANRYIAAAEKEWLYPERYVSTDHWKKLGDGYLLMPEPRLTVLGGEVMISYKGGRVEAFSEYGHKPWQKGYKDEARERREGETLYRFQAEWAMRHGAKYTARDNDFGGRVHEDSAEMMEHHREVLKVYRKR